MGNTGIYKRSRAAENPLPRNNGSKLQLMFKLGFMVLLIVCVVWGLVVTREFWIKERSAYVETALLFDRFDMKRELGSLLLDVKNKRKNVLDSLELQIAAVSVKMDITRTAEFEKLRHYYMEKKSEFDRDNEMLEESYNRQIWNQLNSYVEEYRKINGYDYIYGADGSGVLLAADERLDITDDIIKFVNERYSGAGAMNQSK